MEVLKLNAYWIREIIPKKKSAITFYLIGVVGKSVKIFAYCPKAVDSSSDKPYLKLPSTYKVFSMEMGPLKKDKYQTCTRR